MSERSKGAGLPTDDVGSPVSEKPSGVFANEDPSTSTPLVVCQSGVRSHRAAQFLKQADFPSVLSLAGGTVAWANAGCPVERTDSESAVELSEVVGPH